MSSWFITFCKSVDFAAYASMLAPFYLAQRRRSALTGGLVVLRWLPIFLLTIYCCMLVANKVWQNNLPLLHFNTFGETLLYLKIYYDEFQDRLIKTRIKILAVFFVVFAFLDSFFIEGFKGINSYTNLVESIIVITLALLFFEKTIVKNKFTYFRRVPMFVASVGIVIYLSGTILLYLTTNYFIDLDDEFTLRFMYLISSVLLLLMSALFCRSFLLIRPAKAATS